MTVILINPFRAEISGIERYLFAYDIREILGGPLERAAVLPLGDVLFVLRRSSIAEIVVFVRLDEAAEPADVSEERMSCRAASRSAVLGRR